MARLFATQLSVKDFMGVRFVEIPIKGRMTVITGDGDAGKSSVINALWYVFQGEKAAPEMPLRRGAQNLEILVSIDGDRKFVAKRTDNRLSVEMAPGCKAWDTPQAMMASITNKFCQNPIEFVELGKKDAGAKGRREQVRRLLEAVAIEADLEGIAKQNKADYEARTAINAEVKRLIAEIATIPVQPGLPKDRPDIEAMRARKREIDARNRTITSQIAARQKLVEDLGRAERDEDVNEKFCGEMRLTIEDIIQAIIELEPANETAEKIAWGLQQILPDADLLAPLPTAEFSVPVISELIAEARERSLSYSKAASERLEKLKFDLEANRHKLKAGEAERQPLAEAVAEARRLLDEMPEPVYEDTSAIDAEIDEAQMHNREIDKRDRVEALIARRDAQQAEARALTRAMELREEAKNAAIVNAKMPIEGLTFSLEEGREEILYRGVPLAQAGEATQMKVAIAIGLSAKPDLRLVVIPNGEAFSGNRLADLEDFAEELDFQCIMARVDDTGKVGIFLEQGEVKAVNEVPPKPPKERRKLPIAEKTTS